jgi:putative ABC transport system substrate-binding protein
MKRRELLLLLGVAATVPHASRAQQKAMPVIGFLSGASPRSRAPFMTAFHEGLSEASYVEGQSVAIEHRWAGVVMISCLPWPMISSAARST